MIAPRLAVPWRRGGVPSTGAARLPWEDTDPERGHPARHGLPDPLAVDAGPDYAGHPRVFAVRLPGTRLSMVVTRHRFRGLHGRRFSLGTRLTRVGRPRRS